MHKLLVFLVRAAALAQEAPDHPSVIAQGRSHTPRSIFTRNMGSPEDPTIAFRHHKIVGNVYYVGTKTLSSCLIVTLQGNILIDGTCERHVRTIQKSIEQLGFEFSDTILVCNRAHGDHIEDDVLVEELTGAQAVSMAEDGPALKAMKTGRQLTPCRPHHPLWLIDRSNGPIRRPSRPCKPSNWRGRTNSISRNSRPPVT
jgi:hypothetical protein